MRPDSVLPSKSCAMFSVILCMWAWCGVSVTSNSALMARYLCVRNSELRGRSRSLRQRFRRVNDGPGVGLRVITVSDQGALEEARGRTAGPQWWAVWCLQGSAKDDSADGSHDVVGRGGDGDLSHWPSGILRVSGAVLCTPRSCAYARECAERHFCVRSDEFW